MSDPESNPPELTPVQERCRTPPARGGPPHRPHARRRRRASRPGPGRAGGRANARLAFRPRRSDRPVIDLAARRRRRGVQLLVAAAAVVVAGVGIGQLSGPTPTTRTVAPPAAAHDQALNGGRARVRPKARAARRVRLAVPSPS